MIFSDNPPRSQTKCRRTPSWLSFGTSRPSAPTIRSINPETSSMGRFQFSDEKANTVRTPTPRATQALTQRLRDSTPCLCAATRGRKRRVAQRALPSMTMAMWWGMGRADFTSDRHDLGFLGRHESIDLGDVTIGHLLDLAFGTLLIVLGGKLVLDQFLDRVIGIAAQVAR